MCVLELLLDSSLAHSLIPEKKDPFLVFVVVVVVVGWLGFFPPLEITGTV